ncbi:hypothetical protein [Lyngbya sp. CCY1209]|uniref:hypothetical protein n=1 Tax=Lyngbya sp. CCY1209 TaxID=2886103 RepID=UPI002D2144B5|nr:hypothetical protein [Lyngbya sp. CCY1209]MEB3886434.1 hypothetical protein [Lyngbya sp. CCY1209]
MSSNHKILAVTRPKKPPEPETKPVADQTEKPEDTKRPTPNPEDSKRPNFNKDRPRPSRLPKPVKHKPKPLVELSEAKNPQGEVFAIGDKIWVRAPWGLWAIAEITQFYESSPDTILANFIPKQEKPDWTWDGGMIRAELLQKADSDA